MSDTPNPEAMPVDWNVKTFTHEKGHGVLVHASGEEVVFNIDAWNLGTWKPSRKELAITGAASPLHPQPGEPVVVRWKRSFSGKVVPGLVQPTGRVSTNVKEYKLSAWLKGIQRHTGYFAEMTAAKLLKALARLDEDRAEEWRDGEPRTAEDFAFLLMDLANLLEVDPAWVSTHASWIYADDHRWDRERANRTLPKIVGVDAAAVPPEGEEESLPDYVMRCNAEAVSRGGTVRWHEIALDGDAHVFIATTDRAFGELLKGQYVEVDAEPASAP